LVCLASDDIVSNGPIEGVSVSSFLYRLGRAAARLRVLVVASWVLVLAAAGSSAVVFNHGTDDTFSIPGSESQDALDYLGRVFPEVSGTSAQLVLVVPDGQKVDTATTRSAPSPSSSRTARSRLLKAIRGSPPPLSRWRIA
jgi:RND superfamily putative drug exporter